MRFQITHTTRFNYERPAYDSHNEIRLHPWDSATQRCVAFELFTEPASAIFAYNDFFGNHGHSLSLSKPHRAMSITARSEVENWTAAVATHERVSFSSFLRGDAARSREFYEFLAPSRFVPFSERLRKFFWMGARPSEAEEVGEYVMRVVAYVRDQFDYETTNTNVFSNLNDILKTGGGVCQDFAHLTIGLLRLAGVPARYVSGYLAPVSLGPGLVTELASHAWLEAWLPGAGWTGFDPTHRCATDQRHLGVAVGRDYNDVPPIRGIYRSPGSRASMRVELSIEIGIDQPHAEISRQSQQ